MLTRSLARSVVAVQKEKPKTPFDRWTRCRHFVCLFLLCQALM
jgi:hypothetical protein